MILGGVFVLYHSPTITSPQAKAGRGRVMTSFSRETSTAIVSGEVESCPIRDFRGRFRDFRGRFRTLPFTHRGPSPGLYVACGELREFGRRYNRSCQVTLQSST